MVFTNLKVFCVALLIISTAQAEEKKAEHGGGGGGEAAGAKDKDQREYAEKSSKLGVLSNHIEEADKKFQELVHHKAEAKTPEEKQAIIKEMVEITNQRNKDVAAYNKLKQDLDYRYPSQGEQLERRYQTQSKRSMEEMEGAAGLDEMLTRTKKMIDRKFAPTLPPEETARAPAKIAAPEAEPKKRLRLEK